MRLQLFFAKTYFLFRNLCYTACSLHEIHAEAPRRDVRAGRRSTIGNRVYAKSVSGVRIPISPPVNPTPSGVLLRHGSSSGLVQIEHRSLYQKRSRERFLLTNSATHLVVRSGTWKGGRAAECGGLENRFASNRGNEGSNPSPSAS